MRKLTLLLFVVFPALVSGLHPLRAQDSAGGTFFPVLPYDAPPEMPPQFVPLAANQPVEVTHPGVTRAVVVVHDISRNAAATLAMVGNMAGAENAATIILAPQFLQDTDVVKMADQLPEKGKMFARWPLDGWQNGGDSIAMPQQKSISSFTVIDLLLLYLSDKKFFPDLRQIVIAGHGAGGDFVQRYAALGQAPDILEKENIDVRFLAANPSSYLYFTNSRPQGAKQGFATPDATQCPMANTYPYGLDNLNSYGKRVGPSDIKIRYVTRPVYYLNGEDAGKGDPLPDNGCAAMLQGPNRFARAGNYQLYLGSAFGDAARKLQHFDVIPKTGFDPAPVFGSPCAISVLFGGGECAPDPFRSARIPQ